jgi:hypothetical protein
LKQRTVALERLYSYNRTAGTALSHGLGASGEGATVMTRFERMKLRRRMQRRIRMVVEERRMALNLPPLVPVEPDFDPDATVEMTVATKPVL